MSQQPNSEDEALRVLLKNTRYHLTSLAQALEAGNRSDLSKGQAAVRSLTEVAERLKSLVLRERWPELVRGGVVVSCTMLEEHLPKFRDFFSQAPGALKRQGLFSLACTIKEEVEMTEAMVRNGLGQERG